MKIEEAENYRCMVKSVEIHRKIESLIKELAEVGYEFISYNGKTGIRKVEK